MSEHTEAISDDKFVEVSYDDAIPNNVNLSEDRQLLRALESWHPNYIDWWKEMGPEGFQEADVYLRTAVGVDPSGWAKFGHVKMPEYRWGILLAPREEGRTIPCGRHKGEPAWQEVPGEYRALLRKLIVVQGDTEPASVEQQRWLGATAPSLYDMRNLFQVNVEEGRHLWAMVYLLVKYFGKDGREEAQALLERRSGHEDNPRILGAFNERTPDWLSFFMFTYFTDRDGKMQLAALAESARSGGQPLYEISRRRDDIEAARPVAAARQATLEKEIASLALRQWGVPPRPPGDGEGAEGGEGCGCVGWPRRRRGRRRAACRGARSR